ncbi:MAG TPA: adenosine kinase [Acidimicrobiales bacterium]|nr:adenosine kinase [Acidimicrobiales bacterium]
MTQAREVDVVAVGHAIVDVLAPVPDDLITSLGLAKGTMLLVDEDQAGRVYSSIGAATKQSGGSAANTCAGVASLGGTAAFIGKVADDDLGREFAADIRGIGVDYRVAPAASGPATGRCLSLVTADAERTLCTYLGAGDHLHASDVDAELLAGAGIFYIEGYMCGLEASRAALDSALVAARAAATPVALSLSDPSWVQLHGGELAKLADDCAVVFANEAEVCVLTGIDDVKDATVTLARRIPTVVVTRGAQGCMVASDERFFEVPAFPVQTAVDTTGAGDLFAAGYLFGHVRGAGPEACARLGALAAAEVVSHFGARPQASLAALAADQGLLIA